MRPKNGLLIAVFNISSSSVEGALFEHFNNRLPEILFFSRLATKFFSEIDFQKIQRSLHNTFEKVIFLLKKKMPTGKKKPDLAIIVFSSPYCISQTKIVRLNYEEPVEITGDFLEKIIAGESKIFEEKWQSKNKIKNEKSAEIIECETMNFKLNGYLVKDPMHKKAKSFESTLYTSAGIKVIYDKLKDCISHSFGETPLRFQSFPFVLFNSLRDIFDFNKELILIDIDGEVTNINLIRKGILEEVISLPLGENFLIRRISSVFHFSLEESSSILEQYMNGVTHEDVNKKIKNIIDDVAKEWCYLFNEATRDLFNTSIFPKIIFIGNRSAKALSNSITCVKEKSPEIQFLLPEAFKKNFFFTKGFAGEKDMSLILSVIFTNKLFSSPWKKY